MALILGLTTLLALLQLGLLSRVAFMACAMASAAFYIGRSPWQYVTINFWFWTLTPLARRLIDYNMGFDPVNFVLATPSLMALFMLKGVVTSRDMLRHREWFVGLLLFAPLAYGLIVSLVKGDILPGATGAADWIAPLLYYFYFLANWRSIREAEPLFRNFLTLNALVMIVYGISQFYWPSAWDLAWLIDSGATAFGYPRAYEVRIFGTLNAPEILAIWIATILLLLLHFRTRFSILLVPLAALLLLMTLVRSMLGCMAIGIILAILFGRSSMVRIIVWSIVPIAVFGMAALSYDPKMADQLGTRLSTLSYLSGDESAAQRSALYKSAPTLIDENPLGMGLGAIGRGAVASSQYSDLVIVDSGLIAILLSLGWIAGPVYLIGILLALVQALLAARITHSSAALALGVAACAITVDILFAQFTGFYPAIVWTCAAYAAALGIFAREQASGASVDRAAKAGAPMVQLSLS